MNPLSYGENSVLNLRSANLQIQVCFLRDEWKLFTFIGTSTLGHDWLLEKMSLKLFRVVYLGMFCSNKAL